MDDILDDLPNHLFISLRHEFKATRVFDQLLSPTKIKIRTDISTIDDGTENYALRMETAMAKVNYFVQNVLDGCILVFSNNEWAISSFMGEGNEPATANTVVLCPEEPTDALLAELLMCKFKALAAGCFAFNGLEIESEDGRGMSFTFIGGKPGETLPTMDKWTGERTYFSKPWWERDDASTLDITPDEEDDLNDPPKWAYSLSFIADQTAEELGEPRASAVIVRPEFRPKVIEGGKVD